MTSDKDINSRRRKVLGITAAGLTGAGIVGARSEVADENANGPPDDMPPEESEAYGEDMEEEDSDGRPASISINDQTIGLGEDRVVIEEVFLPEDGYLSIHDARTRLFGEGNTPRRVLESLIGISPLKPAGEYSNQGVQLFSRFAPAVSDFRRSGPLAKSQPVIAIPHINTTGANFDIFIDESGENDVLQGDVAFTENVERELTQMIAANDLALITVEGTAEHEQELAEDFTESIRENFA